MKKIKKILASLMVAVMVLTAAPLSGFVGMELNLDWLDFNTKANAESYSGTCGNNLTWTLDTGSGELVISGEGEMKDYSSYSSVPWYSYRSSIKKVTIGNGVTSIGNYAFYKYTSLTSVTIPDSVTNIEYYAFCDCTSITSITISDSVTNIGVGAFSGCTGLTSITIPDGVTSIGGSVFFGCTGLTSITIPDGVTSIGYSAFSDCTNLTSITIPDSVTGIGDRVFSGCTSLTSVTIPDSVTSIGDYAFYNCSGIIELTMPISAKIYNSSYTFGGCTNIEKITLTKGNGTVQNYYSFSGYSNTYYQYTPWYISGCSEVIIEDGVTGIGMYAFYNCTGITSVTIPDSVTNIGEYAFYGRDRVVFDLEKDSYAETYAQNNSIPYIYIYDGSEEKIISVTVTSKLSFDINKETYTMTINCNGNMLSFANEDAPWVQYKLYVKHIIINGGCTSISANAFKNFKGIRSITIPDSVTSIEEYAFYYCTGLTSITIPDSVTSIGSYAFYWCTSLTSITIPDSVTNIGVGAFSGCTGLTSVAIPDSVISIGSSAFDNCRNLTSVTIGNDVTSISSDTFYNCNGLEELTMPISANIKSRAFYKCINIEKITLTKGNGKVQNYTSSTYSYTPWYISGCPEVIVEEGVTGIGDYMLYGCGNLENVILPESVRSIGNYAFTGCQKLEKITVNNPECTFGTECTSYYTTICGYAGSTAEAYANEMGFDFELIVPCEHNNYHIERKDSTCIETGYEKLICDDCGSTFSYTEIPRVDHDYKTITAPPTCVDEGTVVCLCKVCRYAYISEILDPLGHSELVWVTVKVPSTRNEGVMNQVCPACDEVFDTKAVPAISLSADSTANIDFETNTISGFDSGSSSIGDYLSATNNGYTFTCESEKIATGTVITLTAGDDMINEFEAVIFGDTNGDGWYDGQDAVLVSCLANGMLTKDDVSEAVYTAADCNHDGVIDQLDVDLLNQAGALLSNVDQSKPTEVLLETSAEYVEYLDLIDQSPEIEIEDDTDIPEADVETEETPEQDAKVDFFEMIMNFIKLIFEMLLSYIPMPLK